MSKHNIISIILLLITTMLVILFDALEVFDTILYLMPLLFSINIVMIYKRKKVKKLKSVYNVILLLISFFSILLLGTILYSFVSCLINPQCSNNYEVNNLLILLTTLYTLLFTNIVDYKNKHKKTYYKLLYIITLIVFIIYGRYYIDSSLYHNYTKLNEYDLQYSYTFITQNYLYFNIMYLSLTIYYFLNNKS